MRKWGYLLHGVNDVVETEIGGAAVNFVGALDAQVERRRLLIGEGDGGAVVEAHFGRLGHARVGTRVPLAQQRRPVS